MVRIGKYDPNQHEPRESFDPLPGGWYACQFVNLESRRTRDGQHDLLYGEAELLENVHPEHKGRKLFARLNLWHSNPQTCEIAARELSSICRAVGVLQGADDFDTDVLLRKPLAIKVRVRQADGQYEASNEITGYDAIGARFSVAGQAPPPARQAQAKAAPPPPPPASGGPSWRK